MGLFSKTPKPKPKITFEGIEFTFDQEYGNWRFSYRGTQFMSFEPALKLPGKRELDAIVDTLESLRTEMRTRLQRGLSEWGEGAKLDDGETSYVNLQDLAADGSFMVSWSDGASWGDLGVDFTIKGQAIVDEGWGD